MEGENMIGDKFLATITGLKGTCHASHSEGQQFELHCYDSGGLCGFFYHDIFPYLSVMQFGENSTPYPMIHVRVPSKG